MASFTPLLNKTFDLYSFDVSVQDKYGTQDRTEVLRQLNIPCYFTQLRGDKKSRYGKKAVEADYVFFTDMLDICDNWLILYEGSKYHVVYVHASVL